MTAAATLSQNDTDWSDGISVIVPTYKRPDDVIRALKSVVNQNTQGRAYEIIVADNDPEASARDAIQAFIKTQPQTDIIYTHVPEPGVSNARNGAHKLQRGRFVIYLDDDMEAHKNWVCELVSASLKNDAEIVFGPVIAQMPDENNPLYEHMITLFSRTGDFENGYISKTFGTGGCLIDHGKAKLPSPLFDPTLNEVGGEDDAHFSHILKMGGRIAWTNQANAIEHIPTHRATASYIWKRNFAFGQGPTQNAADQGWRGAPQVLKWMVVGTLQAIIRLPIYAFEKFSGNPQYIHSYGLLSQAIGKIFWFSGFSPRLYGATSVQKPTVISPNKQTS